MNDMYLFISESSIQKYNNEILENKIDNKITRVIANPTENHLKEFNYMELIENSSSEINENEDQNVMLKYEIKDGKIHQVYEAINDEITTI